MLAQFVHAHARGVDDQVGGIEQRLQQPPLDGDGLAQALAAAAQRMHAARLGEAPQQLVVVGHQEDQLAVDAAAAQFVDQRPAPSAISASVLRASMPTAVRWYTRVGAAHGVRDEGLEQRRRDVVDAVEAQVLEQVQRHALARAGQAADEISSRMVPLMACLAPAA